MTDLDTLLTALQHDLDTGKSPAPQTLHAIYAAILASLPWHKRLQLRVKLAVMSMGIWAMRWVRSE